MYTTQNDSKYDRQERIWGSWLLAQFSFYHFPGESVYLFLFIAKEYILGQFNVIFGSINNPIKISSDH